MKRTLYTILFAGFLVVSGGASAHCDSLDGPVALDARLAFEKGDVQPVMKWVLPKYEREITSSFERTLRVGKLSPEAKEMAQTFFLETLIRLHREGEGFGFTGLKPAGFQDPALVMGDKAIEAGSIDGLSKPFTAHMEKELRRRLADAVEARKHKGESVEKGREFVKSYVVFMHYVENLHDAIAKGPSGHGTAPAAPAHAH